MIMDIDIDDIIMSCSKREKKNLYKALLEDGDVLSEKEKMQKEREEQIAKDFHLMQTLEAMSQYELKKTLATCLAWQRTRTRRHSARNWNRSSRRKED